jgi:predicted permease
MRLVGIPLILACVLYLAGFRGSDLVMPVLIAGMPVAASISLVASVFGGDVRESSALVFLSTLLSGVSLPFIAFISYRLAGAF